MSGLPPPLPPSAVEADKHPLKALLASIRVDTFRYGPDKPLVVLRSHWPVERALKVLLRHSITCAPLLSRIEGPGPERWEIRGVVDVMDLAKVVLQSVRRQLADLLPLSPSSSKEADGEDGSSELDATSSVAELEETDTISSAANCSCNNPTQTVLSTASLLTALPLLTHKLRRLLITDPVTGCVGVLSQSDILNAIVENGAAADTISQRRIADVAVIRKSLLTCFPDTPAAVALDQAIQANVSALAVMDRERGTIVANLSVSDVRGLAEVPRDMWPSVLRAPTTDFIRRMRELSGVSTAVFREAVGVAVDRIVSVRPTDVLGTAINMLNATRLHRIWVVDRKSGVPSGLLSISDVLKIVQEEVATAEA